MNVDINQLNDNNEKHGLWIAYYDNENIYQHRYYVNGKINGEFLEFWENGLIRMKCNYQNGKKHGLQETYYRGENVLNNHGCYINGVREGVWTHYWIDGTIIRKSLLQNGIEISFSKYTSLFTRDFQYKGMYLI